MLKNTTVALFVGSALTAGMVAAGDLRAASDTLRGRVVDSESLEPVSGVRVSVPGTKFGAVSNAGGEFRIIGDFAFPVEVVTQRLGYLPARQKVNSPTTVLEIVLKPQLVQTDKVVVSANKRVQAAQDVPISISTVEQKTIRDRGQTRIDEALRYVPGVYVTRDQVNIRGSSGFSLGLGARTAFLLDGAPLVSGDNGDIKFDVVPLMIVDRIEVVKGAGSALFGTGALGGAVNVITAPTPENTRWFARLQAGVWTLPQYEEWRYRESMPASLNADLGVSGKIADGVGGTLYGTVRRSEGYTDYSESLSGSLFGRLSVATSDRSKLDVTAFWSRELRDNFVFWKSLRFATLPPDGTNRNNLLGSTKSALITQWNGALSDDVAVTARTSAYYTGYAETELPNATDSVGIFSDAVSWNTEVQTTARLSRDVTLTGGLAFTLNHILSSSYVSSKTQTIASAYAQAEWVPVSDLTLTLGTRLDREEVAELSQLGWQLSPRAGASYALDANTRLRGSFGRGFRAPSLAERFAALTFGPFRVLPADDLRAEKSTSVELGVERTVDVFDTKWSFELAGFLNDFDDMIEPLFPSAESPGIRFQNVLAARISGVEFSGAIEMPSQIAKLQFSLMATDPVDRSTDQVLKYRSRYLAYATLSIPLPADVELAADWRWQSRFERIDDEIVSFIPNGDARADVNVTDIRLTWTMLQTLSVPVRFVAGMRNVFNYSYTEIIGNLAPPRSVYLQLSALW